MLIPQGFGMIKTVFPPKEMGGAFGAFGPIMGLSAIAGPILAGWLVSADLFGTGWRMIFLINVPLGLFALLGAPRSAGVARRTAGQLDPLGVGLSAPRAVLVFPLVQGRELGWPVWTFAMMAAGIVGARACSRAASGARAARRWSPRAGCAPRVRLGALRRIVFFAASRGCCSPSGCSCSSAGISRRCRRA